MSIASTVKKDIKAAKKMRLPWWAVLSLIVGGLPIAWLFDHFGRLNLMLPICNSIAVLAFMLALKWELRHYAWFWITMAFITGLHVPLILFIPWSNRWIPAAAIAGIDSIDFCLILWVLAVVGKLVGSPNVPHEPPGAFTNHQSQITN